MDRDELSDLLVALSTVYRDYKNSFDRQARLLAVLKTINEHLPQLELKDEIVLTEFDILGTAHND